MQPSIQTLYVMKGLPGCGKSSYARGLAEAYKNTVIVNRDKIREMLKSTLSIYYKSPKKLEKLVTKIELNSIATALDLGYNVVIDATNFRFNKQTQDEYSKAYKVDVVVIDMSHVSVDTCINRDKQREFPVGEDTIRRMHKKYLK